MRESILIFGSGTMGCSIGSCAALAGNKVIMYDKKTVSNDEVTQRIKRNFEELLEYELATLEQVEEAKLKISFTSDIEKACQDCKLVVEAVYEDLKVKQDVFERLDALLPEEIPILSNTSGLRITDISANTKHPERTLTTHFWLPANLIPLVEIVIGEKSSPELAEEIKKMLITWGKKPVIVKKDLPGQLANRILQAVIREAVNIVEIGLASPEDVDTAVKMGMALRFPVWGPLEHVDAVGFEICSSVQSSVLAEISNRTDASPLFEQMISEGNLGYKTGKGFYDWSKKDMGDLVQKRNSFIVHALKKL